MIKAEGLTKRYGSTQAVNDLSFTVPAGQVTGFLGPNGSGKSTTMRLILGLDAPSAGRVTIGGRAYGSLRRPLYEVGALLDAKAVHPGRTAANHLRCLALSNGIPRRRVDAVLDIVGLHGVADRRVGGFSLGMSQRLGIAAALLGDPPVLMFDEPVNGLDPEGVLWVRTLLKSLAAQGRTVFLSSHLMSEMAMTADRLVIIGRGRLITETSIEDFLGSAPGNYVRVRTTRTDALVQVLRSAGAEVRPQPDGSLHVEGISTDQIGDLAGRGGITLLELAVQRTTLEQRYMELTNESVDYRTANSDLMPSIRSR